MRIDQLSIQNFKGFSTRDFLFHPQFNLIVGVNGTGKTSTLDALAVAIGSWFLGVKGADSRHIRPNEVLLGDFEHEDIDDEGSRHFSVHWENVYPCRVGANRMVRNSPPLA